jgi:hypothetical protein
MFVARTCHLLNSITLFCIDIEHQYADIVTSLMGLRGGR